MSCFQMMKEYIRFTKNHEFLSSELNWKIRDLEDIEKRKDILKSLNKLEKQRLENLYILQNTCPKMYTYYSTLYIACPYAKLNTFPPIST